MARLYIPSLTEALIRVLLSDRVTLSVSGTIKVSGNISVLGIISSVAPEISLSAFIVIV